MLRNVLLAEACIQLFGFLVANRKICIFSYISDVFVISLGGLDHGVFCFSR